MTHLAQQSLQVLVGHRLEQIASLEVGQPAARLKVFAFGRNEVAFAQLLAPLSAHRRGPETAREKLVRTVQCGQTLLTTYYLFGSEGLSSRCLESRHG